LSKIPSLAGKGKISYYKSNNITRKMMSRIISIHSFRGGTGKSNTTANIAALLAKEGVRTGIVDTDIQSPGIHVLFGLDANDAGYTLNDYLWGKCEIKKAAYDVTPDSHTAIDGKIFLMEGFKRLIDELELDFLIIDTHPGLNEETLLSIAISDILVVILRPDQQDYQGTGITIEVSRQLEVPRMYLLVNKVPAMFDLAEIRRRVGETYNCDVAGVLPHSDDMMALASEGIFVLRYPEHPITQELHQVVKALMA
jgi:MinD-like ATPase involved in chromosome partitioning or flagellar assembly